MTSQRTVVLDFVVEATHSIESFLDLHKKRFDDALVSVNSALLESCSLDVIIKRESVTRIMRASLRLRPHLKDVTLRIGAYEVDEGDKPKKKLTLVNVLGKSQLIRTWNFHQTGASPDVAEMDHKPLMFRTLASNLENFLFDPFPLPVTETTQ